MILTFLIFFPLLTIPLFYAFPKRSYELLIVVMGISFLASLSLFNGFDIYSPALQLTEFLPIFSYFSYSLGIDGLSLPLVILTTFLTFLVSFSLKEYGKNFHVLWVVLHSMMLGAFLATHVFLYYIFWEAMLIPMYFIIGIWGGEQRVYATTKLVLYTFLGSLCMLFAFIYLMQIFGTGTYEGIAPLSATLPIHIQIVLFCLVGIAFAIKIPIFPFHTWLPDAHVQAPTPGSIILAGVLLKMGTYSFLRWAIPLFPKAVVYLSPYLMGLGLIGIIYGALLSWVQKDIKKMIAYSSVSHMGFIVMGLFSLNSWGLHGALAQMINHGLTTGGLFFMIGILYHHYHTRDMDEYGGIAQKLPFFTFFWIFLTFGSLALPGTGSFIGEWLILLGVFQERNGMGILAGSGVILGAIYMLWLAYKVIWGEAKKDYTKGDLLLYEKCVLGLICLGIIILGFGSSQIFLPTHATLSQIQKVIDQAKQE